MPDVIVPLTDFTDTAPVIRLSINGRDHSFQAGEVVTLTDDELAALEQTNYNIEYRGGVPVPGYIIVDGDVVEPLIFLDFKNGVYTDRNGATTLGNVLVENTDFGEWNPANVVADVGLTGGAGSAPVFTGDPMDLIATGATIVAYFTGAADADALRFELVDSADYTTYYSYNGRFGEVGTGQLADNSSSESLPLLTVGYHKIALTMEEGRMAVSVDGAAVVVIDPADPWTPPVAIMNLIVGAYITLETIGIYPAQDDADLPGLSTL